MKARFACLGTPAPQDSMRHNQAMDPMGVGVVGCGNIAPIYLTNLSKFSGTRIVSVADLDLERAKTRASEFGVPTAYALDEMLADPEVELVVNLTVPGSHYEVSKKALQASKHVYSEKPIVIDVHEADELLSLATKNGLLVGCAPDTVLGAGIQTCREVIDRGDIGTPLSFQAFMMCPGHEGWHPDPAFYYQNGGGAAFRHGAVLHVRARHTFGAGQTGLWVCEKIFCNSNH